MESLKELEIWRDDPKNWVGSNSLSESVNCTILLENLFQIPDELWKIILDFLNIGVADFYQDPYECCQCDCDKRVHYLSENGIGIGCININVKDNVLLNRRTAHINDFLWSIGYSCKHLYKVVEKFKRKKEYKKFIINNNVLYKIEMLKHINEDLCETLTLSEVYKEVLYNRENYPNKEIKKKIEDFITHDCEEFYNPSVLNAVKGMKIKPLLSHEEEREMLHYKFQILTNEPHKFLNPAYKYDEDMGWLYGNTIKYTENMGWWYDHVITCKKCLEFLNDSPTCYCRRSEWKDCLPSFFLRHIKYPVYDNVYWDPSRPTFYTKEIVRHNTAYVIRSFRSDDPMEKCNFLDEHIKHEHEDYYNSDYDSD